MVLKQLFKQAGLPTDFGRIQRERTEKAELFQAYLQADEYQRRAPCFDDLARAGEAHPDFGGPQ